MSKSNHHYLKNDLLLPRLQRKEQELQSFKLTFIPRSCDLENDNSLQFNSILILTHTNINFTELKEKKNKIYININKLHIENRNKQKTKQFLNKFNCEEFGTPK